MTLDNPGLTGSRSGSGAQNGSSSRSANAALQFPATVSPGLALQRWCFLNNIQVLPSNAVDQPFILNQGNIATVRQQNVQVSGSDAFWSEIEYQGKVGWVNEACLDDYVEEFPGGDVVIPNQLTGHLAKQYMNWNGSDQYNMCAELCVAYIVKKDVESVLQAWKDYSDKGSHLYNEGEIKAGLSATEVKDVFKAYGYTGEGDLVDLDASLKPYSLDRDGQRMSETIKSYYLVARVKSNVHGGGELMVIDQGSGKDERNHWVVVNAVIHQGNRVEIYNPFLNRRETYSYDEFYFSCTAAKLSGCWVRRKNVSALQVAGTPAETNAGFQVHLDVPRPADYKAEQYININGAKKTELCGEFCVTYILTKSIDGFLNHWKMDPPKLSDLSTILNRYGYSNGRGFTIVTVLDTWQETQPDLYNYHVGQNQPTSARELVSILQAYGYNNPDDLIDFKKRIIGTFGSYLPSPGHIQKMLETHFLIAGVGIDGVTGRLKKGPNVVRHWEVLEELQPYGRHYITTHLGGNGGWVTLYNPFTNKYEEYSYREFTDAMDEQGNNWDGLWVRRDIQPLFQDHDRLLPKTDSSGTKGARQPDGSAPRWPEANLRSEIDKRIKNNIPLNMIPRQLVISGWSMEDIIRRLPAALNPTAQAGDSFQAQLYQMLAVKKIPAEIVQLLRQQSGGDAVVAAGLAEALCEAGFLVINANQEYMLRGFPETPDLRETSLRNYMDGLSHPQLSGSLNDGGLAMKISSVIRPMLATQALGEIKKIQAV